MVSFGEAGMSTLTQPGFSYTDALQQRNDEITVQTQCVNAMPRHGVPSDFSMKYGETRYFIEKSLGTP